MIINEDKFVLSTKNYVEKENIKKQIVIGHTFNHDMRHAIGWLHRHNGHYKKTAAFSIDAAGFVYKHFDPKFQSEIFNDKHLDDRSIVILLENDGWLIKNNKNEFITWNGDIYKKNPDIVRVKWRGYEHWAPYTTNQVESAGNLINHLCNDFSIPLNVISHNTKVAGLKDYEGVIYRSNLDMNNTDLSPAFNFSDFKEMIENKTI